VWAIKALKKSAVVQLQQVEHIVSEKSILVTMDHPFIVKLAGRFQDERYLYMVLEYIVGGEFFTHLRKAGRLSNDTARFYAAQVVTIFDYLHKQSIIYRDLKPENLLLDREGYLKITDFGFAKKVAFKTYTLCGTPEYIAPEVLLNKGHGKGVDWWTLGVLLFEMIAGQPPYVDDDPMAIYNQIIEGDLKFPSKTFERGAKSLIKRLLTADLTRRYGCLRRGADDIKEHKFFTDFSFDDLLARKMVAPILPTVKADDDTSNFDPYPDSDEETPLPEYEDGVDPFEDF
jgi:serine/threonine protein kinase